MVQKHHGDQDIKRVPRPTYKTITVQWEETVATQLLSNMSYGHKTSICAALY